MQHSQGQEFPLCLTFKTERCLDETRQGNKEKDQL